MEFVVIQSPVGALTLIAAEDALTGISFGRWMAGQENRTPILEQAARELAEYFDGERWTFTVPLAPEGTAFQKSVWDELRKIPYGQTASYGDIAARLGKPGAAVAVGQANSRNPIPIIIPCHRVIGANGKLVGYTGGIHIKEALLTVEGIDWKK